MTHKTSISIRKWSGFTLVEMLITITIFSAILSTLVMGMRTGIRTWKNIREHQIRESDIKYTLNLMSEKLMCIFIPTQGQPAILESSQGDSGDKLTICTLETQERQQAHVGMVWSSISYYTERDSQGNSNLVSETTRHITGDTIDNEPLKQILLRNVQKLVVNYWVESSFEPDWKESFCPPAIQLKLGKKDGIIATRTVYLPTGQKNTQ